MTKVELTVEEIDDAKELTAKAALKCTVNAVFGADKWKELKSDLNTLKPDPPWKKNTELSKICLKLRGWMKNKDNLDSKNLLDSVIFVEEFPITGAYDKNTRRSYDYDGLKYAEGIKVHRYAHELDHLLTYLVRCWQQGRRDKPLWPTLEPGLYVVLAEVALRGMPDCAHVLNRALDLAKKQAATDEERAHHVREAVNELKKKAQ